MRRPGTIPRCNSAFVTAPVPPPSSTTSPSPWRGTRDATFLASQRELGQIAPTAAGSVNISRANSHGAQLWRTFAKRRARAR
jgi:hypothetical protein